MINNHQFALMLYCALNPVLSTIVYANISCELSRIDRIMIAFLSTLYVIIFCIAGLYLGHNFLTWFGVPDYIIQLGGGLLILVIGVGQMLITEPMIEIRSFMHKMIGMFGQSQVENRLNSSIVFDGYKNRKLSLSLSPLVIPIMINPVSILIILFEGQKINLVMQPLITWVIVGVCIFQGIVLFSSRFIIRYLGQTGLLTIRHVSGLLLTILAFEMLIKGIQSIIQLILVN